MRTLFFILLSFSCFAQSEINVLSYEIGIEINDSSDIVRVNEFIKLINHHKSKEFSLDLTSVNKDGLGMKMKSASIKDENLKFKHKNDKLFFHLNKKQALQDTIVLRIEFSGIPIDGLVIGQNKYGNRTFFGDNWPNRAHHWFACVDHPSDKAKVNFRIIAPEHYQVVATGQLVKRQKVSNNRMFHFFCSEIDLPTKVMVFGAADFKIQEEDDAFDFPLSSWIYVDEKENSFDDLECAKDVLSFFIVHIGDYPYEKLANVQSTTRYGGMENAGNIFYDENAFSGNKKMEALVAHEIAHQWFGNSASEKDWPHIWLSEGFATYLTDLYWENKYGTDEMNKRLLKEREKVIRFSKQYNHSVVDTNYADLLQLLNPNSYQKGAWVLHMLRNEVGEELFWKIIKSYYDGYKYNNANTTDFIQVVNDVAKNDYSSFYNQWLRMNGQPCIKSEVKQRGEEIMIELNQTQENIFFFDIDIQLFFEDGSSKIINIPVDDKSEVYHFSTSKTMINYKLDPYVKLLFESSKK